MGMWAALGASYSERTLDLALFTSLENSVYFPPEDSWLVGEKLNYYYYGHYLGVYIGKLCSVNALQSYCLFWVTIAALMASGAFSLQRMVFEKSRLAGLWCPFFVLLIGNLSSIKEYFSFGDSLFPLNYLRFIQPGFWFRTMEVIPDTINETPVSGLLIGETHAHIIALPITILFVAACFLWYLKNVNNVDKISLKCYLPCLFPAAILGTNQVINSWDIASHGGLLFVIITVAAIRSKKYIYTISSFILILLLAYLFYLPFHLNFNTLPVSLKFVLDRSTTKWFHPFLHPGLPFILTFVFIFTKLYKLKPGNKIIYGIIAGFVLSLFILPAQFKANGILFVVLITSAYVLFKCMSKKSTTAFLSLLAFYVVCVLWGCEVFYLDVNDTSVQFRQNSISRFYLPMFVLMVVLSSVVMYKAFLLFKRRNILNTLFLFLVFILFILSIVYPILGTYARGKRSWKFMQLNATMHLAYNGSSDFSAIQWMRENLAKDAIIVEHPGIAPYGMARYSMGTGLRTILGGTHKLSQRGWSDEMIEARRSEVFRIYNSGDWNEIKSILKKYNATIVIYPLVRQERNRSKENQSVSLKLKYYDAKTHTYSPINRDLFLKNSKRIWATENLEIFQLNF